MSDNKRIISNGEKKVFIFCRVKDVKKRKENLKASKWVAYAFTSIYLDIL